MTAFKMTSVVSGGALNSTQTVLVRHLAGVVLAFALCPCLSVRICHKSLLYRETAGWIELVLAWNPV